MSNTGVVTRENDAIALDVSVLKALLDRNRYSHGRTLYYQRISMALRSLQRFELLGMTAEIQRIQEGVDRFCSWTKQDQWDMVRKKEETNTQKQLIFDWSNIEQGVMQNIPEVLSRIRHAASALFTEISRGFFLPFCAVALASLSRIYVLLQRIGRNTLAECLTFSNRLFSLFGWRSKLLATDNVEKTLHLFAEDTLIQMKKAAEDQYQSAAQSQTLKSLGLSSSTKPAEQEGQLPVDDEKPVAVVKKQIVADAADDVGHTIVPASHASKSGGSTEQAKNTMEHDSFLHDELDTNMQLVNDIKGRKSIEKDADSSMRRKRKQEKVVAPKKKAKKGKKKDFFDELFGE